VLWEVCGDAGQGIVDCVPGFSVLGLKTRLSQPDQTLCVWGQSGSENVERT